jgi:hypothetical protein
MLRRRVYFILTTDFTSVIIFDGWVVKVMMTASLVGDNFAGFHCRGKHPNRRVRSNQRGFERTTSMSATAKTSLQTRMELLLQRQGAVGRVSWLRCCG